MIAAKARQETGPGMPQCLNNGQTVAIIGTTLTVAVAIGAMIFASTSAIRTELRAEIQRVDANMKDMREELSADIEGLREELSGDIEGVRAEIKGLDGRLRVVEQTMAAVNARVTAAPTSLGTQPAQ